VAANNGSRSAAGARQRFPAWLWLLCLLLLVGHPIDVALVASRAVQALPTRGAPLGILLVVRLIVTGLGIAAGIALLKRRAGAVSLARWSLVASAVTDLVVYATPFFPSSRIPGDTPLYAAATTAYYAAWWLYLARSKRVKQAFATGL
jgi:hypothetical protein